ncbi:response regulator transcription factor [Flavobacterium sp. ZT3R18]|uniref:response regulator transcription factor n=1 Tax=Flavobacterium sp. ZT3R18 TaxID=2594429 RepID=UPI00117B544D|nr:response regulator transcription factor [Flavobacterium sp. ZT3R18]TRX35519.1 response regulator transcription factor [Flavobacterium sp. ZT3R18]
MINIAIAEDQVLFRKGIISLLTTFNDVKVCIESGNGEELLDKLSMSSEVISICLIDLNMPILNGIETMKQVRKLYPSIKNIILTIHEEEKYIHKLIEEGANAYLAKNTEPDELEKALHAVINQDYYFNDASIKAMHNNLQGKKNKFIHTASIDLTRREKEILHLICQEFTSQEIAQKLFISDSTVNGHRNNLLLKIGCKNTAGLVLFAVKNELFDYRFSS